MATTAHIVGVLEAHERHGAKRVHLRLQAGVAVGGCGTKIGGIIDGNEMPLELSPTCRLPEWSGLPAADFASVLKT